MGALLSCFPLFAATSASPAEKVPLLLHQDEDPNAALANELRGQVLHVDMTESFIEWPMGAKHAEYERLRVETDRVLEQAIPVAQQCQKFKKCDFASFSCLWWPLAAWEDLYTAMLFTVCLFVWDDTIDTNEDALAADFGKASLWRQQSLAYFKHHLQLSPDTGNNNNNTDEPPCPDTVCLLFREFGARFCAKFGNVQRRRMYAKIKDFVEHNESEQAARLAGHIPTYDEYMCIRYGVTGVRMFALLLEIANQFALPSWIMDSHEMDAIIKECNFIIIVINDILSLKKEITTDCIVNIVPVLYKTTSTPLNHIIAKLTTEMHASRDRLDATAARLDTMTKHDPQLNAGVLKFVDGVRIMDTGTLLYSIESPRYGVAKFLQPDGSLDIVL